MSEPAPSQPPAGHDRPAADLADNPGVIATTLLSGVIAVAVAAAEWVGSGEALASPTGILWSVVALLGLVAMLLATIREFGQEQLVAAGELEEVDRRHAEHFLDLAEEAEPNLTGPDQAEWLDRCDLEHANLRAALRWAVKAGETDRAQRAAGAIWRFWQQRGHLTEGRRWLEEVLALPAGQGRTPTRAKALAGAGGIAWWQEDIPTARAGRPAVARSAIGEALGLFREVDSPMGIVSVILGLAYLARWEGRYQDAVRLAGAAESLREQVGGRPPLNFLAGFLGDPEAEARTRIPADAAEAAWEEGRRLSVDAALGLAMAQGPGPGPEARRPAG